MASAAVPKLLVVGGNGFLGSAVCKAAVAKGWDVSSMSSSGKPYTTPAGHSPKWVGNVSWHAASAFDPPSYSALLSSRTAVVHTLGILLEDAGYKDALKRGNLLDLAKAFGAGLGGGAGNPLKTEVERPLTVLDTFMAQPHAEGSRPFVYISAADAFRPAVPEGYIRTKREAELEIQRRTTNAPESGIRPIFMRPGLMYHPHVRPISTLPAFLLSLSASLPLRNPFASKSFLGGAFDSLHTHPIHVDHVASAVIRGIEDESRTGVIDLDLMRHWAGFKVDGAVPGQGAYTA